MPLNRSSAGKILRELAAQLAAAATDRYWRTHPESASRWGPAGRHLTEQDFRNHCCLLAEALDVNQPVLFADYMKWVKALLERRRVPWEVLAEGLECIRAELATRVTSDVRERVDRFLRGGQAAIAAAVEELPSYLETGPCSRLVAGYMEALLSGDRHRAMRMVLDAVERGTSIRDVYLHVFQPSQREIGRLWLINRVSVAQEHFCTASTQLIMSQLYPRLSDSPRNGMRLVAACAGGDLHEMGVRMISDFFEMAGWDTFYLGANTPAAQIVRAVRDRNAHLLAVSVTLTQHLSAAAGIVRELRADERTCAVRLLVGGGPFNTVPDLWKAFGADAYAGDAASAVETADRLFDLRAAGHGYG